MGQVLKTNNRLCVLILSTILYRMRAMTSERVQLVDCGIETCSVVDMWNFDQCGGKSVQQSI